MEQTIPREVQSQMTELEERNSGAELPLRLADSDILSTLVRQVAGTSVWMISPCHCKLGRMPLSFLKLFLHSIAYCRVLVSGDGMCPFAFSSAFSSAFLLNTCILSTRLPSAPT